MQTRNLKFIEIAALTVSALVAVVFMLRAAEEGFDLTILLFLCWAISPYVCFLFAETLLRKMTSLPGIPLISCVVSVLMLAFTWLSYAGSRLESSSTGALIFLFAPFYLFIGSFAILIIGSLIAKFSTRDTDV